MEKHVYIINKNNEQLAVVLHDSDTAPSDTIIIFCHGLRSSKESGKTLGIIEGLAKKGIASLRFDFSGHGDSEGNFTEVTFSKATEDLLSVIDYVNTLSYKHIGLVGSSFGGNAAIFASLEISDLLGMALRCPVSDYKEETEVLYTKEQMQAWKDTGVNVEYHDDGTSFSLGYDFYLDGLERVAYPIAENITVPTLVVHGDNDEMVPLSQSEKLVSLMPQAQLHIVKEADHRFSTESHQKEMIDAIVTFFGGLV